MSLIHWWPLTGHARDMVGNKHGELIGSPSLTETGKIGYCYSTNTTNTYKSGQGVNIPNCNLINELGSEYSFACWFKVHGTHPDYNGTIMSSGNWNTQCWTVGLSQNNTQIDVFCDHYNQWLPIGYTLSNNVWYHLVSAQKNGVNYVYLNGELLGTRNSTALHRTDYSNLCIGRETYAGGYFGFNGDINDIRVYNHCLSPREVKLLAQGLVAHYKLETYTPNLLINAEKYTYSSPLTKTSASTDGYSTTDMYCQVTPGETYYFSCETDGQWYQHNTSGVDPSNKYVTVWFYLTKTYDPANTGYDNPVCLTKNMGNGRWIYQIPSGYNGLRIRTNTYSNGTNAITVKFWNFHLSKGNVIVPYSSQIIDCSGYGNHGTYSATFNPSFNSPRYKNCAIFENNKYISIPSRSYEGMKNSYTFSYWAKHGTNTAMDGKMIWGFHDGGYLDVYPTGGYLTWNTGDGASNPFMNNSTNVSYPTDGLWHHYAITGDGSQVLLYIDGEYKGKAKTYKSMPNSGTLFLSGWNASENGYRWNGGQTSDFRLYATALSAAAVKELYQSSISFLDNGTLQCSEIVENNTNLKYNQNGIVQANQLNEIGYIDKMKIKTLSDGSAWARIHWLDVTSTQTYFTAAEVQECTTATNRFSLMKYVEYFKQNNGYYEFILTHPKLSTTAYNRWKQTSSPNSSTVSGFSTIGTQAWGEANHGIRKHGGDCVYNCDEGGTWYAPIGQTNGWGGGIPAANQSDTPTTEIELWVRIDDLPKLTKLSMFDKAIQTSQIYEL